MLDKYVVTDCYFTLKPEGTEPGFAGTCPFKSRVKRLRVNPRKEGKTPELRWALQHTGAQGGGISLRGPEGKEDKSERIDLRFWVIVCKQKRQGDMRQWTGK